MTPTWLNPSATEYSDIKVDNIKHHAITHTHTQSQSLLSQSLHHRSPHKANQPGRVIRMHYQTMECLHDALDHCLVQFFLHCLKIPRSTSLHSWHLNPAHKCLHCYCQFQAGKKVRRSWYGHDTNMTESECNWIQRHQIGQHQARSLISFGVVFHFHDYGRKGT